MVADSPFGVVNLDTAAGAFIHVIFRGVYRFKANVFEGEGILDGIVDDLGYVSFKAGEKLFSVGVVIFIVLEIGVGWNEIFIFWFSLFGLLGWFIFYIKVFIVNVVVMVIMIIKIIFRGK